MCVDIYVLGKNQVGESGRFDVVTQAFSDASAPQIGIHQQHALAGVGLGERQGQGQR